MATNYFESRLGRDRDPQEPEIVQAELPGPTAGFVNVAPLIYPPEMRGDTTRPCMVFTAHERTLSGMVHRHPIWFPAPANIAFDDGAEYGTSDLGMKAGAVDLIGRSTGAGAILDQIKSVNKEQGKALALKALPVGDDAASLVSQQINNPNTNTTFNKNAVRSFGFNFKMVARSQSESALIRQIQSKFRHFLYASRGGESNTITLEYPPVWTIKFMNMDTGVENPFIPRVYSSYCTSVNTNFNATGNVYFTDNAPLEVDMALQFQETRALNRHDIEQMENDQLGNRGINAEGRPLTVTNLPQPDPAPTKGN